MKNKKTWLKVSLILTTGLILIAAGILYPFQLELKNLSDSKKTDQFKRDEAIQIILTSWVCNKTDKINLPGHGISRATANEIVKEAMRYKKPLLLLALIEMESGFIPTAVSSKGAIGLTQIMFNTHAKLLKEAEIAKEKRDLFDIKPSIAAGNLILITYLEKSNGDVKKALELYLGGSDGAYLNRILLNLANLYVLVQG
jgi:soluble lytic murein transglycosylase-like protein